jgi:DNA modification methylase
MIDLDAYNKFLAAKVQFSKNLGITEAVPDLHPWLRPHAAALVQWNLKKGRAATFASFGLHKTSVGLETCAVLTGMAWNPDIAVRGTATSRALIVAPLGVRQEFRRDAGSLAIPLEFIRSASEVDGPGVYVTNYESVRGEKIDMGLFDTVWLDEAAVLRGFGGTATFRALMNQFEGTKYRFVATATPSPNEYIEILSYAAFLGVMDVGAGKTRFFKRDSSNADKLTLHAHKEKEFWLWVSSWAIFMLLPSDLGFDDTGYVMPELEVRWHSVPSDYSKAGQERDGQGMLLPNPSIGVSESAREKRDSLDTRIAKLKEIRAEEPDEHRIIWHDLEAERHAICGAIPDAVAIYGSQTIPDREAAIVAFSDGEIKEVAAKPQMLGAGTNLQRHCARAVFLGIGFKFFQFIQAVHRIQRFGQTRKVRIDIIYTDAEQNVRRNLEQKWKRHNEMVERMRQIVKEFGLSEIAFASVLSRSMGTERREASGQGWSIVNNDTVPECAAAEENSVDLIVTSIPFATQYEYTPTFNDFGHTDDNDHFWAQMDFLTPSLFRMLSPGRNACIHVKDRIVPGGINGLGFQTLHPFHAEAIYHYQKHGFAFLGMKTVTTDVVRENNQTYRLGWTEQCKDGSRMGCGVPEYVLIFRKPPSDLSSGYADKPVVKSKPLAIDNDGNASPWDKKNNWKTPVPGTGYSRSAWQLDAHGYARSSGDRLLSAEELAFTDHADLYKWWEKLSLEGVYDYAEHKQLCETMDQLRRLPATFMLWPPHSVHGDVWTDITRMLSLNSQQSAAGRETHLCPMQFDIADRLITQFSMPGEVVFDPFAGIGTVPLRALKLGRIGKGVELSATYWRDGVRYCRALEAEASLPTLFGYLAALDDAAD